MERKTIVQRYSEMTVVSKAALWFMICSFLNKGLSFITTPIFTRLLTTEQFGLYSVYTSWLQILLIFATFRLDYNIFLNGMSKYPDDRDGYTSSMLGLTTIITTIMFVFYLFFHKQINSVTQLSTVVMCALFVEMYVDAAVNFWSLREKYEFRYKAVVAYTLLSSILGSLISIWAVTVSESKGVARIVSGVMVHAIGGILLYYLIFKRGKKFFSSQYSKFAICFNIPLMPHYFSAYLIEESDRIIIQRIVGLEAAALYSIAYTVGGLVRIFTSALNNSLLPMLYRFMEKDNYKAVNKTFKGVMFSVVCLLLFIALTGPEIILVLGGAEYKDAIGVIPPVAASVYFSFLYMLLSNVELYLGENKFAMKISIVGAVANIVLNFLAIPILGYVAAAYTTLICYIFFAIGHMVYINYILKKRNIKEHLNYQILGLMGIISIIGCMLIELAYDYLWMRVAIGVFLLGVSIKKRHIFLDVFKEKI